MANNLFISYDLYNPGQNHETVITEIKKLGEWAKVHKSLWYVSSHLEAQEAAKRVWATMNANDTLMVIDTTNEAASWRNLKDGVANFIRNQWFK